MIRPMSYFATQFKAHLKSIGWSPYRLGEYFKTQPKEAGLSPNYIYKFCRGEPIKEEAVLEKLANVPELGLTLSKLKVWWLIDQADGDQREMMAACLASIPKEKRRKVLEKSLEE